MNVFVDISSSGHKVSRLALFSCHGTFLLLTRKCFNDFLLLTEQSPQVLDGEKIKLLFHLVEDDQKVDGLIDTLGEKPPWDVKLKGRPVPKRRKGLWSPVLRKTLMRELRLIRLFQVKGRDTFILLRSCHSPLY